MTYFSSCVQHNGAWWLNGPLCLNARVFSSLVGVAGNQSDRGHRRLCHCDDFPACRSVIQPHSSFGGPAAKPLGSYAFFDGNSHWRVTKSSLACDS